MALNSFVDRLRALDICDLSDVFDARRLAQVAAGPPPPGLSARHLCTEIIKLAVVVPTARIADVLTRPEAVPHEMVGAIDRGVSVSRVMGANYDHA